MKKFKKVYVEITNVCNLSCDFCPKTGRTPEFMDVELFEKILNNISGVTKSIYLHVLGEPFLHPKLGDFLDLSSKHGIRVNITTNGTLIDSVKDVLLSNPVLRQINISLHSFEANDSSYQVDDYLNKIFEFMDDARKIDTLSITLRLWNLKEGCQNERNRYILERIEKYFDLSYSIEEKLTPCNGIRIADRIFLNQAMTFEWPITNNNELEETGFCYGLRDQIAFLVDGTVVPCCLDGEGIIKLGNIRFQSLEEILQGSRAKNMFDCFSERKVVEELCRKCSYRLRFNR